MRQKSVYETRVYSVSFLANQEGLRVCMSKREYKHSGNGKGVVSTDGEYCLPLLHNPYELIFFNYPD